ncbi:radical SAM protein [Clostridium kluyveri]|uniref:Radical SAM protein n=1 Tax=Clostridium kluyveri TaxID=1534 RepID=A0A1L5FE51_CLOKL|nr:radical SAM protein [Clostridium kluyveri]APM41302.1 radical SAM protein [Clostridium kluyveri]
MQYILRKSLLYKTGVEYGDYTINHVQGCSHGCKYPCYAMMIAKRFGRVKSYEEWCKPKIVENVLGLLEKEIPKYKSKIKSVQLCFSTDPFMFGYKEISDLSIKIIQKLNYNYIKCIVLTKGLLPRELSNLSKNNKYGITLVSLNEDFRKEYEPGSAPYSDRIDNLKYLHNKGFKTWVSIEPYPTPNIIEQNFQQILNSINFVDRIIFEKLNYNPKATKYRDKNNYYNDLSKQTIEFCELNKIKWYIKAGTQT